MTSTQVVVHKVKRLEEELATIRKEITNISGQALNILDPVYHRGSVPTLHAESFLRAFVLDRDCSTFGQEIVSFKQLHDREGIIMDELRDIQREHNNKIKEHCSDLEEHTTKLLAEIKKWAI